MAISRELFEGTDGDDLIELIGIGADKVKAGAGDDVVFTGTGPDAIYGEAGNDVVYGGVNPDKMYGGADDDALYGGAGADRLFGGSGDDILRGGDGDDVLYGDITGDRNQGSVGADFFVFDNDDGADKVFDFVSGTDKVILLDGDAVTLTYTGSGNTIATYGLTTITFYDEILTLADFEYVS